MKKLVFVLFLFLSINCFAEKRTTMQGGADNSTMALWHFNSGSGSTAYDTSENRNHGTITNALWTETAIFEKSLDFDDIGDYVEISSNTSLNTTDKITISAWVKYTIIDDDYDVIMTNGFDFLDGWVLFRWRSGIGDIGARIDTDAGLYQTNLTAFSSDANVWYYVVATYDSNTGDIKLYVDGDLITTSSNAPSPISSIKRYITIGDDGNHGDVTRGMDGQIEEPRLYNRCLSEGEIKYLYSRQIGVY
jgi:hypothetical protein